jgi:hypothetical protein
MNSIDQSVPNTYSEVNDPNRTIEILCGLRWSYNLITMVMPPMKLSDVKLMRMEKLWPKIEPRGHA